MGQKKNIKSAEEMYDLNISTFQSLNSLIHFKVNVILKKVTRRRKTVKKFLTKATNVERKKKKCSYFNLAYLGQLDVNFFIKISEAYTFNVQRNLLSHTFS